MPSLRSSGKLGKGGALVSGAMLTNPPPTVLRGEKVELPQSGSLVLKKLRDKDTHLLSEP